MEIHSQGKGDENTHSHLTPSFHKAHWHDAHVHAHAPNSNPSSNLTIPMDMSVLDVLLSVPWGGGLGYITWAPRGVRGSSAAAAAIC